MDYEIWKPIAINPYYMVSNLGRVKSVDHPVWCSKNKSYSIRKGHIMKANNSSSKKYWRLFLPVPGGSKCFSVHRLVAEAFIPNPNNFTQVNHIDGDKNNNCVSNLEWCDQSHNIKHAHIKGLISNAKQSANCHLRKLTEENILFIKNEFAKTSLTKRGDKMRFCEEMRKKFNLKSRNTIFWIIQGGTNKYINNDLITLKDENYI